MATRTSTNTPDGKIFPVPWTEWHVTCAECTRDAMLLSMGRAETVKQAEQILRDDGPDERGWTKRHGLWVCPDCGGTDE